MIRLTLNGKERELPARTTLPELLEALGVDRRLVAVAYNGDVVPRDPYAAVTIGDGDRGPAFQSLCLASLDLYAEVLPELEATGIDLRYRRDGVLHLALTEVEAW